MKNLLTSREFWVTILGMVVILLGQFVPGFKIDIAGAASMLIVVCSYLYGISVDPGPGGWRGWLQSRKFWGAVVGFALVILDGAHVVLPEGLTSETLVILTTLIGSLIVTWAKQPNPEPEPEPDQPKNPETPAE